MELQSSDVIALELGPRVVENVAVIFQYNGSEHVMSDDQERTGRTTKEAKKGCGLMHVAIFQCLFIE